MASGGRGGGGGMNFQDIFSQYVLLFSYFFFYYAISACAFLLQCLFLSSIQIRKSMKLMHFVQLKPTQ
jgi:hypothetical protein